jgi:hypothetical protein
MPDRPLDINLTQSTDVTIGQNPSPEEVIEYRQRLARVYDRGMVIDRLQVDNLPENMYGEWHSADPLTRAAMDLKGFIVDTEYAPKSKLHDGVTNEGKAGDVIHYIMPKWKKIEMDKLIAKRYDENHGKKDGKAQKEERDFSSLQKSIGMDAKVNSTIEEKSGPQIQEALQSPTT